MPKNDRGRSVFERADEHFRANSLAGASDVWLVQKLIIDAPFSLASADGITISLAILTEAHASDKVELEMSGEALKRS